jgi:hypothetical protein
LLAVEVADDFPALAKDGLPEVDIMGDLTVLIDEGRGFAEAVLGLTGCAALELGAEALGAGRAFWEGVGAADVQVLDFFRAEAVTARLPAILVSLSPSGLVAVPTRESGAPVQSLMPLPRFKAASPYCLMELLRLCPTPLMLLPKEETTPPAKPPALATVLETVGAMASETLLRTQPVAIMKSDEVY